MHELGPLVLHRLGFSYLHELLPLGTLLILHGLGLYLYQLGPLGIINSFNIACVRLYLHELRPLGTLLILHGLGLYLWSIVLHGLGCMN